jgi:hypothetical protein
MHTMHRMHTIHRRRVAAGGMYVIHAMQGPVDEGSKAQTTDPDPACALVAANCWAGPTGGGSNLAAITVEYCS